MVDSKENNKSDLGVKGLTPKTGRHLISPCIITSQITYFFHDIKGSDHQLKNLLIVKQILLVSTLGNV